MVCLYSSVISAYSTSLVNFSGACLTIIFYILAVVNENVSLVISRQLLTDFCTHLPNLPDATAKAVYHFTLEKIQPRVISFEEQVNLLELSDAVQMEVTIQVVKLEYCHCSA